MRFIIEVSILSLRWCHKTSVEIWFSWQNFWKHAYLRFLSLLSVEDQFFSLIKTIKFQSWKKSFKNFCSSELSFLIWWLQWRKKSWSFGRFFFSQKLAIKNARYILSLPHEIPSATFWGAGKSLSRRRKNSSHSVQGRSWNFIITTFSKIIKLFFFILKSITIVKRSFRKKTHLK